MDIKRMYIVETVDGKWPYWISTSKKGPQANEFGFVNLGKYGNFAVNPHKFRQYKFKKKLYQVQLFQEGKPEAIDFFHELSGDTDFTPKIISVMGKSRKISQLMTAGKQPLNLIMMALIMSLFINGIIVIYLIVQGLK